MGTHGESGFPFNPKGVCFLFLQGTFVLLFFKFIFEFPTGPTGCFMLSEKMAHLFLFVKSWSTSCPASINENGPGKRFECLPKPLVDLGERKNSSVLRFASQTRTVLSFASQTRL